MQKTSRVVTNGEYIELGTDAGQIRQYEVIHEHDAHYWVKALNGFYRGELLTFPVNAVWEYAE